MKICVENEKNKRKRRIPGRKIELMKGRGLVCNEELGNAIHQGNMDRVSSNVPYCHVRPREYEAIQIYVCLMASKQK